MLSDNALTYRNSAAFKAAVAELGAVQRFIKLHCPSTNGKVDRLNRTLQTEGALLGRLHLEPRTRESTCTPADLLQH